MPNKWKILATIIAVIALFMIVNIFWLAQTTQLNMEKNDLNSQLSQSNNQMNRYTRPQVLLITSTFVDNNFTGIVFNEGYNNAHNAQVLLKNGVLTYFIKLGDIDGQQSVSFNEYVPPSPGQTFNMYYTQILWNEKSYDQ